MKRIYIKLTGCILCILLCACGSKKKMLDNEVLVETYCSEDQYPDTEQFFRASFDGTSLDRNVAKNIALTYCRGELANKLKGKVMAGTEAYAKQYGKNGEEGILKTLGQNFEMNVTTVAKAEVGGATVICSKMTQNKKTKEFTAYITMQIEKTVMIKMAAKMFENISAEAKARIDYDRNKFREYLENYLGLEN